MTASASVGPESKKKSVTHAPVFREAKRNLLMRQRISRGKPRNLHGLGAEVRFDSISPGLSHALVPREDNRCR